MKKLYFIIFISFLLLCGFNGMTQKTASVNPQLSKIAWTQKGSAWVNFKPAYKTAGNKVFLVNKAAFGLGANDEMRMIRQEKDKQGIIHYRYQQYHNGVPVDGAVYIIHEKAGKASTGNGQLVSGLNTLAKAAIFPSVALNKAMQAVPSQKYIWQDNESEKMLRELKNNPVATYYPVPELVVFDKKFSGVASSYKLAYKIEIYSLKPLDRKLVYIDAFSGEVIHTINMIQHTDVPGICVTKYNGNQPVVIDSTGPGAFRLREAARGNGNGIITRSTQNGEDYNLAVDVTDDSTFFDSDDVAANAHWAAEKTYDYYWNVFGRNSFDNNGATILSYVHYSTGYANAFWDGTRMTYGDGDGQYSAFTSLDICGHEITHAVTEHTANLVYQDESGALNESFSDMFGESIEFYADTNPDWLMGEDVGTPFRSMSNPNDYQNPDTYHGTYWDLDPNNMDNGGVHTNSGVGNYWFYLLTDGGSGTNDIGNAFSVTGLGHGASEAIAYNTLAYYLTPSSQYYDVYLASVQAAENLFGICSNEAFQTANAWYAVGVGYPFDSLNVYLLDVKAPATSCGMGMETVSALLYYNGCNTSLTTNDTISLAYRFDGGAKVFETRVLANIWNGGDSLVFNFTVPVDASALGNHTIDCWVRYGTGTTGFTDSIMGYSFTTLLQQNIDVGVVGFVSPVSSCSLTSNEPVGVKIHFYGCDSLAAGDTIAVAYSVNGGSPVIEEFILPVSMFPTDTFTYTFTQPLNAVTDGTYTLDAWTLFDVDTLNTNDMFSGYKVKNTAALVYDTLGFEETNAEDFFLIQTTRYSNVYIRNQAHAPGSTKGLLMTGGNALTYINMLEMPSGFNTWQINAFLSAKSNFCVDATTWNSVYLKFDLKQTHGGTLYSQYLGGNASDYNIASNMRILADNNQIGGTYNPTTPGSDPFVTHLVNLSNYSGTDFTLTFETRNISKDTTIIFIPFVLDNAYIDNVHFFPGPLAADDSASVKTDSTVTVDVLLNDNNHGISGLKFNLLTMPQHGTVQINPTDTTIFYTPDNVYQGYDSLTYRICYASDTTISDDAKVFFHVYQSPVAVNDTVFVKMDSTVTVNVVENDNVFGISPSYLSALVLPAHGTVLVNSDSAIVYSPDPAYFGEDDMTYRLCFSSSIPLTCSDANIHFRVYKDPLANIDTVSVKNDTLIRIPVLDNDNNFGFSSLNTSIVISPDHGVALLNSDTITYMPNSAYFGYDTLTYQICYSVLPSVCDQTVVIIRVLDKIGINEISDNGKLDIYPNPFKSRFTLEYSSLSSCIANVTITDVVGRVVVSADEQFIPGINRKVYNLEKESKGIYFVSIITPDLRKVFKVTRE